MGSTFTVSCAVRGDGSKQGGYVILDCFDASGKLLKAIWKELPVDTEWKTVKYDVLLDEKAVGVPGLAAVGLRILCAGEGTVYLDAIELKK